MAMLSFAGISWLLILLAQQSLWNAVGGATLQLVIGLMYRRKVELSIRQLVSLAGLEVLLLFRTQLPSVQLEYPQGFSWLRDKIRELCLGVSQDAQALVLGITNGDDSALSASLKQQMRDLSLSHLTAVSGTNCSILIAAVFALLAACGFKTRARIIGCLVVLVLYLGLVGDQPSVYRAAAMATFALLAMLTHNRIDPIATLGVSVVAILLIDDSLAGDYGFALSALATAGLLILAPTLFEFLKAHMPNWLALSLAVTVSAQLFCLPVLAFLQPEQSSLSLLANVLVEPVVALITLLGISATVLSFISSPLAQAVFWLASIPAQYIVSVTKFLAGLSFPVVQIGNLGLLLVVLVLAVTIATRIPRTRPITSFLLAATATVLLALQITQSATSQFPIRDWFFVSCDVGQGDATVIRSESKIALIDVGRESKLIDRCLTKLGITKIDLLVLTHFDADHVAGLEGALDNRQVSQALVTSYPDDRPGADWIQLQLRKSGIPIVAAEKGMRGKLGNFDWLVLSPHRNGNDSEDANDGSVTMLWQSAQANIVTLADIGEPGQMRLGQEIGDWDTPLLRNNPTILKVSHHGSADQFPEFYEWLKPTIATVSVGVGNSYGHPNRKTIKLLSECAKLTLRTDEIGTISIASGGDGRLIYSNG